MPRARSPERDLARQMWFDSGGQRELKDIAAELGVSPSQVRNWKAQDKWQLNCATKTKNCATNKAVSQITEKNVGGVKRKRGGQPGNHNATGGPYGNTKAQKYGFLAKYLPEETLQIVKATEAASPADILWHQIQMQYAAILRAQQIAYVRDQWDKTKEIITDGAESTSYDIQQAWEKQENFLNAQSRAMSTLSNMIARYEKMVSGEQSLQVQKLQAEIEKMKAGQGSDDDDKVLQYVEGMKHVEADPETD